MANLAILTILLSAMCCQAAPKSGGDFPPKTDGVAVVNEPCYVHDGACDGYPVCCVTAGTCISKHSGTVSSTTAYYEGGCQSLESRKKEWSDKYDNADCKQQGECMIQHLAVCKGGFTKPGFMTEIPKDLMDSFMAGSCEADCPKGRRGGGHYSRGTPSNVSTTTTTTTTVITRVTDTMYLAVSDVSAVKNKTIMGKMVGMSLAKMAGFGTDTSVLTAEMPDVAATMAVTYHFDVSNLHSVKHDEVKTNMAAHTDAQINDMLAMHIGTCGYTVTKTVAPTEAPSSTSSAHSVRNMVIAFMATAAGAFMA